MPKFWPWIFNIYSTQKFSQTGYSKSVFVYYKEEEVKGGLGTKENVNLVSKNPENS